MARHGKFHPWSIEAIVASEQSGPITCRAGRYGVSRCICYSIAGCALSPRSERRTSYRTVCRAEEGGLTLRWASYAACASAYYDSRTSDYSSRGGDFYYTDGEFAAVTERYSPRQSWVFRAGYWRVDR